jgi:hypothetical protein
VNTSLNPAAAARYAAVAELFEALNGLMVVYESLPEPERSQRWADDAERITGQVGLHLSAARARISPTFATPALALSGSGGQAHSGYG